MICVHPKPHISLAISALCLALGGISAHATGGTWQNTGSTNSNWNTASNWVGGTVPGATSGTTSSDMATFDTLLGTFGTSGNPIVIDSAIENIGGITFKGPSGNFAIGTVTGSNSLLLSGGGVIQIDNLLTSTNAVEPLVIEGSSGTYTFTNNSAAGSGVGAGTLNFAGGITVGAAGTTALTLDGSNMK